MHFAKAALPSLLLLLAVALGSPLAAGAPVAARQAEPAPNDFRTYTRAAIAAYREKRYDAYLENMKRANELNPLNPTILYNLASARALNGGGDEAVRLLDRVARMGLSFAPGEDSDFDAIRTDARFVAVVARFAANAAPVARGKAAVEIAERDMLAEGVAYDPTTKTHFVSSVRKRKIVAVDAKGAARDFSSPGDGLWSVFGMKVDASRRALWAATSAFAQGENFDAKDKERGAVVRYDLKTGKLAARYDLPDGGHALGDLAVAPNGDVYVTDSLKPIVYVLRAGAREGARKLETFATSPEFVAPQGLDFSPNGKTLFVADYVNGLLRVDVATGKVARIAQPDDVAVAGIDGLYQYRGDLIAIQNGTNPHRVVRFRLSPAGDRILSATVLDARHPAHDEPTLGVLVGSELHYVANSQWGHFGADGRVAKPESLRPTVILRTGL